MIKWALFKKFHFFLKIGKKENILVEKVEFPLKIILSPHCYQFILPLEKHE